MPRNGDDTRAELLAHAARLMANRGTHQVTNREIIEAAEQRNTSALSYHFGSRDDLILAVLSSMGPTLDEQRGVLSASLDNSAPTADLIHALTVPYSGCLHTESGRHYVQIVDQLRSAFTDPLDQPSNEPHLARILKILSERPAELAPAPRRERLIAMVTLMTSMVATRALLLERGGKARTSHEAFTENLEAMLVSLLQVDSQRARSSRRARGAGRGT